MGRSYLFECPTCNNEISFLYGMGIKGTYVRCDRCGKERFIKNERRTKITRCKCGGYMIEDGPVKCNNCDSLISISYAINAGVTKALWD